VFVNGQVFWKNADEREKSIQSFSSSILIYK